MIWYFFNEFGCLACCTNVENLHNRDFSGVKGRRVKLSMNLHRLPELYIRVALPLPEIFRNRDIFTIILSHKYSTGCQGPNWTEAPGR
jgi:hypothetical protein